MMRLAEIERRAASTQELLQVVGAMRSMASMRLQEALHALESVRGYSSAIAQVVRAALRFETDRASPVAASRARRAIVLCTSEHGFVGGLNERLLQAADARLTPADSLLLLGSRGLAIADERGRRVGWNHPMATRLSSVPVLTDRVLTELFPRIVRAEVSYAEVIFPRYVRNGTIDVCHSQLFPLELPEAAMSGAPTPQAPLSGLPLAVLLEKVTSQYLLGRLTEAVTEALAGENGARFLAMEAAHDNISRKLELLRQQASGARQEEITTELLDLVIGEQAVKDDGSRTSGLHD